MLPHCEISFLVPFNLEGNSFALDLGLHVLSHYTLNVTIRLFRALSALFFLVSSLFDVVD